MDAIKKRLLANIDGVEAVHEFHVWQLAGDRIIASAHIRCKNLSEYMKIAEKVKEFFHNEGIHSTTIQPEFTEVYLKTDKGGEAEDCVLDCPKTDDNHTCVQNTCCGPSKVTVFCICRRREIILFFCPVGRRFCDVAQKVWLQMQMLVLL